MIDTEKRAHDVAMALIKHQLSAGVLSSNDASKSTVTDISVAYCDAYFTAYMHLMQNL